MVNKILGIMLVIIFIGVAIYGCIVSEYVRWLLLWLGAVMFIIDIIPTSVQMVRKRAKYKRPSDKH